MRRGRVHEVTRARPAQGNAPLDRSIYLQRLAGGDRTPCHPPVGTGGPALPRHHRAVRAAVIPDAILALRANSPLAHFGQLARWPFNALIHAPLERDRPTEQGQDPQFSSPVLYRLSLHRLFDLFLRLAGGPHFRRPNRLAVLLAFSVSAAATAATYNVSSIADLQARINAAGPGDLIVLADGTYTTDSTLQVACVGTAAAPITIAAGSVGGVTLRGARGIGFSSPATHVVLQGFVLTQAVGVSIPSSTNFIRVTRCTIALTIPAGSDVSYVNLSGDDVEIDHNDMGNKSTLGEMLDIAGSGSQVARRLWVHHNYFHDFKSPGGNGAETIRWGLSGLSLSTGNGLCEYNLFARCTGENECISNKSSGNTYRYNTFLDQPGAELSQRHGNDCVFYGNYFRHTQGLRIYGDRNLVFSNYFESNSSGINMGNGDGEVEAGADLTSHDKPDHCVVVYNTLVNNDTGYEMGGRTGGLGADGAVFANNVIQGGTTAVSISSTAPYSNPTWSNNLIWNAGSIGNIPTTGYRGIDPLLVADAAGVFHLGPGSPAIDAGTGDFPGVTADLDGQPRGGAKDIGADEFSAAPIVARLLTLADVGPNATDIIAPPTITANPESQTVADGQSVAFRAAGDGAGLTYQWSFNGAPIAGAVAPLLLTHTSAATVGRYACTIGNPAGSVVTADATLALTTTTDVGRLTNLSVRATVGSDAGTMIGGFAVQPGTSGAALPVLLRGMGPSLVLLEVPGFVADPQIALIDETKTTVASNDNWGGDPAVRTVGAGYGAFPFVADASLDAALYLRTLTPAHYTMHVTSTTGTGGVALAEIYDVGAAAPDGPRLVNVSARTLVGTDANVMIAGFTIGGSTSQTVLIRGVGPGLTQLGVPGVLADPQITLYLGGAPIAGNDDWDGDPTLRAVFNTVGAFGLDATSHDAALLVTLKPGGYTAIVGGTNDTTGIGLVEVYAVP